MDSGKIMTASTQTHVTGVGFFDIPHGQTGGAWKAMASGRQVLEG